MLFCEERGLGIKNCTVGPIEYYDPSKKKIRKYYPDFIVEDFLIVEVKWLGFVYEKKKEEIRAKKIQLEKFCEASNYGCLFVTNDLIKKKYIEKAKRIHKDAKNETAAKTKRNLDVPKPRRKNRKGSSNSRSDR